MNYSVILLIAFAQSAASQQVGLYSPADLAGRFGTAASDAPFTIYSIDSSISMRYQQVMSSSSFSGDASKGGWITGVSLRADEGESRITWGGTLPDIQVSLSTTARQPDALSPVFAENIGTDSTLVFGRGSISVEMYARNGPGPATTFGILFQKPFFYDPRGGNLLLDVRNFQGVDLQPDRHSPQNPGALLDAVDQLGDGLSRIFSWDVNATRADRIDSLGLFCSFNFTPVPEPSAIALFFLGSSASCLIRRGISLKRNDASKTAREKKTGSNSNSNNRHESR